MEERRLCWSVDRAQYRGTGNTSPSGLSCVRYAHQHPIGIGCDGPETAMNPCWRKCGIGIRFCIKGPCGALWGVLEGVNRPGTYYSYYMYFDLFAAAMSS